MKIIDSHAATTGKTKSVVTSLLLFLAIAAVSTGVTFSGHIFFPSVAITPIVIRSILSVSGIALLIYGSRVLLKNHGFYSGALGLNLSRRNAWNMILGCLLAFGIMAIISTALWIFLPYRFATGSRTVIELVQDSVHFSISNTIEELVFRGFPLILLSYYIGWKRATWVLALPFGLMHLSGLGFSIDGLKMVTTTALMSLTFCYAFITTGSLLTSISLHITLNVLLHAVTGLDGTGRAYYTPVFQADATAPSQTPYLVFLGSAAAIAAAFFYITRRITGTAWQNCQRETSPPSSATVNPVQGEAETNKISNSAY